MIESLEKALTVIKEGGIILYPTDTIWGIGCDARNSSAVKRIYALKRRVNAKAMLMLVGSDKQLMQYVNNIPDAAWQLMNVSVNPLTIIYDNPINIAPELIASDGSAGFRITAEPFSKNLCLRLRAPIVSTSANISGENAPATFRQISEDIITGVDYVVQHARNRDGSASPSNIIKVTDTNIIKIIR